jgi:hypothetical protein
MLKDAFSNHRRNLFIPIVHLLKLLYNEPKKEAQCRV